MVLHRSIQHKMDYHLSLFYPSDILAAARYLDNVLWGMLESVINQHIPRKDEGRGFECLLDIPVFSMEGQSFQELLVRSPVRLRGFGLCSMEESSAAAFIGAAELALPSFSGSLGLCRQLEHLLGGGPSEGDSWWRCLVDSGCRTAQEYLRAWQALRIEGEQCCNYL